MLKLLPLVLLVAACGPAGPRPTLSSIQEEILTPRCSNTVCHGGANPARGLNLETDTHANVVDVESTIGTLYVSPGDPDDSLLLTILRGPADDVRQMPPGLQLDDADLAAVEQSIADGAADD